MKDTYSRLIFNTIFNFSLGEFNSNFKNKNMFYTAYGLAETNIHRSNRDTFDSLDFWGFN